MKVFGRLLLATALIVPAGLTTAQSAGATPKDTATCTGNTGTLRFNPGLRSTDKTGQTLRNFTTGTVKAPTSPGRIEGCTGIGIAGETGGDFSFLLKGAGGLTCSSVRGKTFTGVGQLKWDDSGSNSHIVSKMRVQLKFNSYKAVTFSGIIDSTYLKNTKISGTASIPDTLKPIGVGDGQCQNKKRVKTLAYEQTSDLKL